MEDLEKTLGYHFKDKNLLRQALTHSSCSSDVSKNYERLEFLGDRVLGVAMAHLLYNLFPDDPEGNLSPRHTRLVRKETVAAVARELGLNHYIRAENKNLRDNENVLCDVAEAVIGAICIESGFATAIDFVDRHWRHLINQNAAPQIDNKTTLQEMAHRLKYGIGCGKNKKAAEQDAAAKLIEELNNNG